MKVTTYEATVENGQIKLPEAVRLPENATVYIVVPGPEVGKIAHMRSPRLAQPWRAADLIKEIVEGPEDAGLR